MREHVTRLLDYSISSPGISDVRPASAETDNLLLNVSFEFSSLSPVHHLDLVSPPAPTPIIAPLPRALDCNIFFSPPLHFLFHLLASALSSARRRAI